MNNFLANIHVIKPQSSFRRKLPFIIFMNFHEQSPFHDQKLKKNCDTKSGLNPIYSSYDAVGRLFEPPLKVVKIS